MNSMKNVCKRGLAMFVAFMMCLSMLPGTAFAAGDTCPKSKTGHVWLVAFGDDKGHGFQCFYCDAWKNQGTPEAHEYDTEGVCTICGYEKAAVNQPAEKEPCPDGQHEHLEYKVDNCDGKTGYHYAYCSDCGYSANEECTAGTDGKCTNCGQVITTPDPTPEHEHKYNAAGKCECGKGCGQIDSNGEHKLDVETHPATCTTDGWIRRYCSSCGYEEKEDLPAAGHQWGAWQIVTPATCKSAGEEKRECQKCTASETKAIPIDPANHVCYKDAEHNLDRDNLVQGRTTAGTCVEKGSIEYLCPGCNAVVATVDTGLDPANHVHGNKEDMRLHEDPTCTEKGREVYVCVDCGAVLDNKSGDPLGHAYGEWTANGDVTHIHTCTRCGSASETEPHAFGAWTGWVTSGTVQSRSHSCTVCGYTQRQTRSLNDDPSHVHTWDDGVVTTPAACEEDGVKTHTCQCGETTTEPIPATGHDWDDGTVTRAPGCESEGERTFVCGNDPSHTRTESIPATGHDWDDGVVTKDPTEDEEGERTHTCENCGETKVETIDRLDPPVVPVDPVDPVNPVVPVDPVTPVVPVPGTPGVPAAGNGGGETSIDDGETPLGGETDIGDGETPLDDGTEILDGAAPLGVLGLNNTDHFAYMIGYGNGTIRPEANITRAEVATIFFRLMTDEYRAANWAADNAFTDVAASQWFNNAISTAANAGKVGGYGDGTFRPNDSITRAEFAVIAVRFLGDEVEGISGGAFKDTEGHWAAEEIGRAAAAGIINGYSDGTFRPDEYITRAEAVTIINNMLGRVPDKDHMLDDMTVWSDNPEDAWYYEAIQEATNSHDYDRDELGIGEIWSELEAVRDWHELETR